MMLLVIMQATRLARFASDVWQETRRLRRSLSGPAEE